MFASTPAHAIRCFQCHATFPANEMLESLPWGNAFAFDPSRGRLWLICTFCRRWSLVPIESRWETLEELEKLLAGSSRLIARTDNVALFEVKGLQVVRVGPVGRPEEAWWRYGRELGARYSNAARITRRGEIFDTAKEIVGRLGMFVLIGWPAWPKQESLPEDPWLARARRRQFGDYAWRGEAHCDCGAVLRELLWTGMDQCRVDVDANSGNRQLQLPCVSCGRAAADSGLFLAGLQADHLIRRALTYRNFAGASEKQIGYATTLIDQAGGAERAIVQIARQRDSLSRLISTERIALEIAAHEENERVLAGLEIRELEVRWKDEEEIASIIDGELTVVPFLSALVQRSGNELE